MFLELFLLAKKIKFLTKAISYGAGNSKFLKIEIGWISDFGRTSASQQKKYLMGLWKLKIKQSHEGVLDTK